MLNLSAYGELFFWGFDEIGDIQFSEASELLLVLLRDALQEALFLTKAQTDQLIDVFISKLPKYYKAKFLNKNAS